MISKIVGKIVEGDREWATHVLGRVIEIEDEADSHILLQNTFATLSDDATLSHLLESLGVFGIEIVDVYHLINDIKKNHPELYAELEARSESDEFLSHVFGTLD